MFTPRLIAFILSVFVITSVFAQTPSWQWAESAGNNNNTYSCGACTDSKGYVYVSTGFSGTSITIGGVQFNNNSGGQASLLIKYDPSGHIIWARSAVGFNTGSFNGNISVGPAGICTDRFGNVFLAGSYQGSAVAFGNDTLVNQNPIQSDIFLVKYDSTGNVVWAVTCDGSNSASANSVSTDFAGNAYITGIYTQSILFGNTSMHTDGAEMFNVKYDTSGQVVWAVTTAYQPGPTLSEGFSIAADSAGNTYVTGNFQPDSIILGNISVYNPSPYGSFNAFTVKYDTGGHALWAEAPWADNNTNIHSYGVAVNAQGNVCITGTFNGNYLIFGHDTLMGGQPMQGDVFITEFDTAGHVSHAVTSEYMNGLDFGGLAVKTDPAGNWYVLASNQTSPEVVFGNDSLALGNLMEDQSIIVAKFDSTLNASWIVAGGEEPNGALGARVNAMAVDFTGAVYVVGSVESGTAYLGNTSVTAPSGVSNFYIAKLDTPSTPATAIPVVQNAGNQVNIFPNPSSGMYTVTNIQPNTRLIITDAIGRQVMASNLDPSTATINLNNAANGVYFFSFISTTANSTQKVVLSK
jgi:hypothetical protein